MDNHNAIWTQWKRRTVLGYAVCGLLAVCAHADAPQPPAVFLSQPAGPIHLAPKGGGELKFGLAAGAPSDDLVIRFERAERGDGAPGVSVQFEVNGDSLSRLTFAGHEFYTIRIPRLMLRGGGNVLRLVSRADESLELAPPQFLSHEVQIAPAPKNADAPPQPLVWGEPIYDWDARRITLWAAVQGRGMGLVKDAQVSVQVRDQRYPMQPTTQPGHSALARAVPVRYVAQIPFADLEAGVNSARLAAMAEGYMPAETWFRLPMPSEPGGRASPASVSTAAHVTTLLHPLAHEPFIFHLALHDLDLPVPGLPAHVDYQALVDWIARAKAHGHRVLLAPMTKPLHDQFGDWLYLLDGDGLVVRGSGGWDPAIEPGGVWDRLLHQRRDVAIADLQRSMIVASRSPGFLSDGTAGDWELGLNVEPAEGERMGAVGYGSPLNVKIMAAHQRSEISRVRLISSPQGVPGQVVEEWRPQTRAFAVTHRFTAGRPGYFRVMAEAADGTRALSSPIFMEVRPAAISRVVERWGECRLYEPRAKPGVGPITLRSAQAGEVLPIALGREGCARLILPFTPLEDGHYTLELGLDPGACSIDAPDTLNVSLDGRALAEYHAAYPIDGHDVRHIVPFRVPLGHLAAGQAQRIEVSCEAPGDGIGLSYAYLIRTGTPGEAMVDLHSHSKVTEDWSNLLHRTMGYNYIATNHGISERDMPAAIRRAAELSDGQLTIDIGGERRDHFGAVHMSLGFVTPPLEGHAPPTSGYGSVIPVGINAGGIASMNHPSQDRFLSFLTGEKTWGTNDPYYHGFAGWSHPFATYGQGDHYWGLLTHFEYFNGYSRSGVASGRPNENPIPRMRWHEQIGRYCRGERLMPLFGVADTDTKTFQQHQPRLRIGSMYMGTYVHAASLQSHDIEAALMAGNATLSAHADTRMLVTVRDAEGRLYQPGNHLIGAGPFEVHVEAWAPRPLAELSLVGPRGAYLTREITGQHVVQTLTLEELGPYDWLMVELRGEQSATGAVSNPFLR